MKAVWKFPLLIDDVFELMMPDGAQPLCVQTQGNQVCMWALVDPSAQQNPRRFRMCGTGHPLPDYVGRYIGTFQDYNQALVFHVFEAS